MKQFSKDVLELLDKYVDILYRWNRKMNLTSYTREEFFSTGLSDCIALGRLLRSLGITEFVDIGTGYGMPGMVLKILFPEFVVHLVDASEKKIAFLDYASTMVGIKAATYCRKLPDSRWNMNFNAAVSKASMKEGALLRAASGILSPKGMLIYFAGEGESPVADRTLRVRGRICYRRDDGTSSTLVVREKHDSNDC